MKYKDSILKLYSFKIEGNVSADFDLTNHGNPKHHTTVPHKHEWTVIKTKNGVKYERSKYPNIPLNDEELELVERWREYDN